MTFDPAKATEIEGMTAADFGVWKSARQGEVRRMLEYIFPFYRLILDRNPRRRRTVPGRKDASDHVSERLHWGSQRFEGSGGPGDFQPSGRSESWQETRNPEAAQVAVRDRKEAIRLRHHQRRQEC